ncbi:MAG: hypothetical protein GW905_03715 [Rhodobacterales bacterium]|nr:hypothetical protein [Rhodobacterales bacterium]
MIGSQQLSMFPTFMFEEKKRVPSPVIFVDNRTEKIILTEQRTCDHTQKYMTLESNPYTIVEGIFENVDVKELTIRKISLINRREMSAFLMYEMADAPKNGWDEDLIRDVVKALEYD